MYLDAGLDLELSDHEARGVERAVFVLQDAQPLPSRGRNAQLRAALAAAQQSREAVRAGGADSFRNETTHALWESCNRVIAGAEAVLGASSEEERLEREVALQIPAAELLDARAIVRQVQRADDPTLARASLADLADRGVIGPQHVRHPRDPDELRAAVRVLRAGVRPSRCLNETNLDEAARETELRALANPALDVEHLFTAMLFLTARRREDLEAAFRRALVLRYFHRPRLRTRSKAVAACRATPGAGGRPGARTAAATTGGSSDDDPGGEPPGEHLRPRRLTRALAELVADTGGRTTASLSCDGAAGGRA